MRRLAEEKEEEREVDKSFVDEKEPLPLDAKEVEDVDLLEAFLFREEEEEEEVTRVRLFCLITAPGVI